MTSLNPSRTTLKPLPFSQAPLAFHATFHGRPARVIPVVCLSPPGIHLHVPSPRVGPGATLAEQAGDLPSERRSAGPFATSGTTCARPPCGTAESISA